MLNSLDNLLFFNDNGLQIKLDKSYNLLWTINQDMSDPLIKIDKEISGYVIGDENTGLNTSSNLSFYVLNQGCIKFNKNIISEYNGATDSWEDNSFFDNSLQKLKDYKNEFINNTSLHLSEKEAEEQARIKYIKTNFGLWLTNFIFFPYINNNVIDSLDYWQIRNNRSTYNGKTISYIYDYDDKITSIIKDITIEERKFFEDSDDIPDYYEYYVTGIEVTDVYKGIINQWICDCNKEKISKSPDNLYSLFPFVSYVGSFTQEKVSADLVTSNTLFALTETDEGDIIRPYNDTYNLLFAFGDNSQCKFVESDFENDEVIWKNTITVELDDEPQDLENPQPISLSFGFIADEEGAYQNLLHIYLQLKANPNILYKFGAINIKTEVIGEDERYRTLFANFGIPDPITYPNLFKEKDPDEELTDYELVNRKSKELFLTYNDIFPYVGTYKALINAVKFLGYDDIFFREWYKIIKNENDHSPYNEVSFQSVDIENKATLESKLKSINVTYEEFLNYKKLNKLSLIYYFNKVDEDNEYDVVEYKTIHNGSETINEKYVDIPSTIRVYDYTGDALLAKLLSLKKWLEKFIIGVNCHIADVTGEGVYFYRVENYAYHTNYQLLDYQKEGYLTPNFIDTDSTRMINSSAYIRCSLNEFNSLKFSDYEKTPIKAFIRKIANFNDGQYYIGNSSIANYVPEYSFIESEIPVSNPIEALVPYNELSYILNTSSNIGSLYEQFSIYDKNSGNVVYINDGQITNYNEYSKSTSFYNKPIIDIELANIRSVDASWSDNILYTIKAVIDQNSGQLLYQIKDVGSHKISVIQQSTHFILLPENNADLKYSEENRFNLPLFMFKNYKFVGSDNEFFLKDKYYILEILDGKFLFDNLQVEGTNDEYVGQELQFIRHKVTESLERNENYDRTQDIGSLEVLVNTTYESPRSYIYKFEPFINDYGLIYKYNEIIEEYNKNITEKQEKFISDAIKKFVIDKIQEFNLINYINTLYKSSIDNSNLSVEKVKQCTTLQRYYLLSHYNNFNQSYGWMYKSMLNQQQGLNEDEILATLLDLNCDDKVDSSDIALLNNLFTPEYYIGEFLNEFVLDRTTIIQGYYIITLQNIQDNLVPNLVSSLDSKYDVGIIDTINELFNGEDSLLYQYIQDKWSLYIINNQKTAYEKFASEYKSSDYYNFNRYVDIKVNRIGDYSLLAKAYDEYNNVYVSLAGNQENVYGLPQVIDTYINSEYSNVTNNKTFDVVYHGEQVSENVKDSIKKDFDNMSINPIFPKTYRIFDIDISNNSITYDNISYATDLNFNGDEAYVYLNNFTDKIDKITFAANTASIYPYVYNYSTNRQNTIFNTSSLKDQSLNLVVYNDVLKQLTSEIYFNSVNTRNTSVGKITNLSSFAQATLKSAFNSSTQSVYIVQSDYAKINRFKNNNVYIDKELFNVGDIVKLSYVYPNNGVLNGYMYDDIIAQEATRITDVNYDSYNKEYVYTLAEKPNNIKDELGCDVYISRGNTKFVNYELKVKTNDIVNRIVDNVLNDTIEYQTNIAYNYNDWFASDYLDNSYSMFCIDYNPLNLFTDWVNYNDIITFEQEERPTNIDDVQLYATSFVYGAEAPTTVATTQPPIVATTTQPPMPTYINVPKWNFDMFKYQNKTLVLTQNRNVVISSEDLYSTFGNQYKSIWNNYVDSIEELNWKYGSVINDVVFIKTNILGENTWKLTTIDKYGNTINVPTSQKLLVCSED